MVIIIIDAGYWILDANLNYPLSNPYSDLKLFTGFANAALIA
jgi:hypothetical protein